MLTLGYTPASRSAASSFGEIDTGNINPVFYSTLKRLENAERMLWDSFQAAMGVLDSGIPGISVPQSYIDNHNAACEAVALQSFAIVAQRNALPGVIPQQPSPFPKIGVVSASDTVSTTPVGFSGMGKMVNPSEVRVVMRYPDREEVVGDVAVGQTVATTFATTAVGGDLGIIPWAAVAIVALIAGVVITVSVGVALSNKYSANSEIEQAKARWVEAQAAMAKQSHETYNASLARCVGVSTDPKVVESCMAIAAKAVETVNESVPKPPAPPSPVSGYGFLGTVGIIAIVAVLTFGGMVYYKKWKRRQALRESARTTHKMIPAEA